MTANLTCFIYDFILTYYDSVDRSSFVVFYFVHIERVACLVHESRVVFRHNTVCSTQGSLFLLLIYPQDLSPAAIPTRNTSLALTPTHYLVVLLSRLWNSGAAIKSAVMIFTGGSGEGPTV